MGRRKLLQLPKHERLLVSLGENLRFARLRRRLTAAQVAERAGISRSTLTLLEKGTASSSIGVLLRVLAVLGLEGDLLQLAKDDVLGRKLEDARLTSSRKRAPKRSDKRSHKGSEK
ncbi:MAG: helix-turn-helix transcriptional regulator [Pirellulales bacterium]